MKLFSCVYTPNNRKVEAFIAHYGMPVDVQQLNMRAREHKTPEFLRLNPLGKLPTLQDGDFALWESNAIMMYLAEVFADCGALPEGPRGRADVERWLHWQGFHFSQSIIAHYKGETPEAKKQMRPWLDLLEGHLDGRQWLCDSLSAADFSIATYALSRAGQNVDYSDHPGVRAWMERVAALEGYRRTKPTGPFPRR